MCAGTNAALRIRIVTATAGTGDIEVAQNPQGTGGLLDPKSCEIDQLGSCQAERAVYAQKCPR